MTFWDFADVHPVLFLFVTLLLFVGWSALIGTIRLAFKKGTKDE